MIRILRHIRHPNPWQKFCLQEWLILIAVIVVISLAAFATIKCLNSAWCTDELFRLYRVSP